MSKLFEIANEFSELFDRFDEFDELEDPREKEELMLAWYDTLTGIEGEFEVKAESVAQYIKQLRAEIAAIKEEESRLAARRKAKEYNADGLLTYLKACMEQMHREKIDTPRCRISLRNNAESVQINNPIAFTAMLHQSGRDDLLRFHTPDINKTELKRLMQQGEAFEGAQLVRTRSVIIK